MLTRLHTKFLLLFFLSFNINALGIEKNITVKGRVIDAETNQPLEYATVSFYSHTEQKLIDGVITDLNGLFSVRISQGTYDIKVEYISYTPVSYNNRMISQNLDLGTIALKLNIESLEAVEITAERTTVEIKLDKKIYNIGKDLTTSGGTVSDALNNIPSVSVDIEGGISLRGNENVRILINGKPSALAGFGDTNLLSQLPAEAIERVEVITSPSARYDAEGTAGILNIILRQKETLGFNGSLNLTLGQPDNLGISSNLNYRTEKFNLFSNLGFRYFDAPRNSYQNTRYFDKIENNTTIKPEFERIIEDEKVERLNRNYNGNIGLEYFLSKKTSLSGSVFFRYGEDADLGSNNSTRLNFGDVIEKTLRREGINEKDNSYQISLNYITKFNDTGHQLTGDFQFESDSEEQYTQINEIYLITNQTDPEPFQEERIFATEDEKEYLIQTDYVLPIGKNSRFEAGYRGTFENEITNYALEQENIQDGTFFINDTISNVFDYTQNINALYTQYGNKVGAFSFLIGLRLENTQLKGIIDSRLSDSEIEDAFGFPIETKFNNNYLGLFPTINVIYNLSGNEEDSEENLAFGFNRRINRPNGWYINPFPTRSSRTNVFQGNPNLDPAFASTFDIGYLKRWENLTLSTSIYYQYETGSFERIQENTGRQTSDEIDIIRSIPVNLSTNKRTGGEFGIMYNPDKSMRFNTSFNIFQFQTQGSFNDVDYGAKNVSWFTRFSSKIRLFNSIDWQTNANYRGARQNAQSKTKGIFSLDLAISKELFNNKATISLNARDLFNSRKYRSITETEFFVNERESQWRQRQINLSFILRFNQQKQQNKGNGNYNGNDENLDFQG
ncbi:outer membrane beta-barrel family protein [Aestuariivivens sediminis]|uniref:outer membrane beta-barrel family protein n=1 Tax=Aestuariivivens sediminis TaxID=2913557 RepID=UPI001F568B14|nr:outer membrane beta-barrel family protein [Aestuariivivens sediminis]